MNKQQKKEDSEDKKREEKELRYFLYVIIFIVIIIAFILSIKYIFISKPKIQSYSYNNFIFKNISGMWYTEIQKQGTNKVYNVPLHFGPLELRNISINGDVNSFKNKTNIYITFDPSGNEFSYIALSASEISINLAQTFNITPIAACTTNKADACANRPVVDCKTPGPAAIYLRYSNITRVYVENNCIFVEGYREELVKAADRLLLKWFSIMP